MVAAAKLEEPRSDAEAVGFIFPIYLSTLPLPVRRFLRKIDLSSAVYLFYVATRIGFPNVVRTAVERALARQGRRIDARWVLNMASSTPTGLAPGKGDQSWLEKSRGAEFERIEAEAGRELDGIVEKVAARSRWPESERWNPLRYLGYGAIAPLSKNNKVEVGYYVDDSCVSCGICEEVCLSGKVNLVDGKPIWQDEVPCYYCFACFNFCPEQSILVSKKWDRKDGRYHHPDVTVEEVASQKHL